jgi:hypothetical protein
MSHGYGHAAGEGASEESIAAGYELNDTRARPLIYSTIGVFVLLILSFALIAGLLFVTGANPADTSNLVQATSVQLPPEPRVEQNPNVDGDRIVGEAAERLETYGWVQQRDGRAHIPIERSMELLLEQGVNPFGQPEASQ